MYLMENYARLPVSFERGEGVYLYDGEGRRYLDFVSGIGVVSLGHSHPDLVEVIRRQAGEVLHTSNLFINPWQEELAEKLVREFGEPARVFFCNSGTEANEAALKLVRRYWRDRGKEKYRVLAFRKSFHGRTYGSLSATGQEKLWEGFEPLLKGFDFADLNDMDSVREAVGEETGAVLVEIIQGEGGVNECSKEFLEGLSALCRDRGILLVVDEVQTGAGRTGRFFCYQHYGIRPDIVTLAKGLGGGIPIGAVIAREEVAAAFVPGTHGSTFGGNALACRVASLVVDRVRELLPHVQEVGRYLRKRLEELDLGEVRGRGLMLGVDTGRECRDIVLKALRRGLLVNCTAGSVLRFLPPLVVQKEHVDRAVHILREVI